MRSDAAANRQRIVEAARDLFAERGIDVDVREICERAGVGMGTLYRHFPTKEALVDEVVFELAKGMTEIIDRFDSREAGARPLVEWLAFMERWGPIGQEVHARFKRRPAPGAPPEEVLRQEVFEQQHERRLGQWQALSASGAIRTDLPVEFMMEASDALLGMYFELRDRWGAERTREWVVSLFEQGIRRRDASVIPWQEVLNSLPPKERT